MSQFRSETNPSRENEVSSKVKKNLTTIAEKVASTYFGQRLLRTTDKVLMTIEQTAKWSLPTTKEQRNQSNLPRPLPWLLFIPALLMLRLTRASLSFVAVLCGKSAIQPESLVRFLQNQRRNIRQLKYQGLRNIRQKEQNRSPSKWFLMFEGLLSRLSCVAASAEARVEKHIGEEVIVIGNQYSKETLNAVIDKSNEEYDKLLLNQTLSENEEYDDEYRADHSYTDSGTEVSEIDVTNDNENLEQTDNGDTKEEEKNGVATSSPYSDSSSSDPRPTVLITSDYDELTEGMITPPKTSTESSVIESFEYQVMENTEDDSFNSSTNDSKTQNKSSNTSKSSKSSKGRNTPKKNSAKRVSNK